MHTFSSLGTFCDSCDKKICKKEECVGVCIHMSFLFLSLSFFLSFFFLFARIVPNNYSLMKERERDYIYTLLFESIEKRLFEFTST